MPDIPVSSQVFDLVFHPSESLVFSALLTGEVNAFSYDDQGAYESKFSVRPSKKSCRGLEMSHDGSRIWAVGKDKSIFTIDTVTGSVVEARKGAHDAAMNRIKRIMPNMLATGDDDGVVKLWDSRVPEAVREYKHHFDFISDFLWLDDKKHLVCTSGDGSLSVLDVRSKKTEPFAQSEDQEDELLSVVSIKSSSKLVVGTQIGILSIFNRKRGYGDCVDRIPGHPHSVDALCNIPSHYPNAQSTILTGSSDGILRAIELFPTKLLGVVADHGEFPIERIKVDKDGEGRWVGSVGHEETIKLTDLKDVFEDGSDDEDEEDEREEGDDAEASSGEAGVEERVTGVMEKGKLKAADTGDDSDDDEEDVGTRSATSDDNSENGSEAGENENVDTSGGQDEAAGQSDEGDSSDDEDVEHEQGKRKRKKDKDPFGASKRPKGRNEIVADPSFFANL